MKSKEEKGITLIALVVTIIVLIILAGVSINLVFGNLGIVTKAKEAKRMQEQAELNEQIALGELSNEIGKTLGSNSTTGKPTDKPEEIKKLEELKKSGTYTTAPTTIKDSNGNLIKVPQGFKVAEDSGINVTEGIVIEDNDIIEGIGNNRGNQYVWVPVGKNIKKSDGSTIDITLGRYVFDSDGSTRLKQDANNYLQKVEIWTNYVEIVTSREGVANEGKDGTNTTALNLKKFLDSVKENGGYYIARYEASYGTDEKANSKVSNRFLTSNDSSLEKTEGTLWNYIKQIDAAKASRNIYSDVTTDLINSYAWDTALIYIQKFSGDTKYTWKNGKSINSSLTNTGVNKDEKCKINDMASNLLEWSTEYCNIGNEASGYYPCTYRGGAYGDDNIYSSDRHSNHSTVANYYYTFRTILYN